LRSRSVVGTAGGANVDMILVFVDILRMGALG
jgi:hypothetical protein